MEDSLYIFSLKTSLNNIETGASVSTGGISARDPWGSPYLLDENEKEGGLCTSKDHIMSAGPDGDLTTGGDNIVKEVPFFQCPF